MKKIKLLMCVSVTLFLYMSCEKGLIAEGEEVEHTHEIYNPNDIIESLGFDSKTAIDMGDCFFVEDNIILKKAELSLYLDCTTRQAIRNYIVGDQYRYDIKVFLGPNMPESWIEAVTSALSMWNSFNGLCFRRVTSEPYDIYINIGNPGNGFSRSSLPTSNGKPGADIILNSQATPNMSSLQKRTCIVSSIATCLGIIHTDWMTNHTDSQYPGVGIPGTPNTGSNPDPSSIFNRLVTENSVATFSHYDQVAVNTLFPPLEINASKVRDICPGETVTFSTSSYIPVGATIEWRNNGSFSRISGSGTGTVYTVKNIAEEEKKDAEVYINLKLANGYTKYVAKNVHVVGSYWSAARVYTFDNKEFSIDPNSDGRNYNWWISQSQAIIEVQGYNWTCMQNINQGPFTIRVEYTHLRCGNRVRTRGEDFEIN